ncbi:VOC family protein [Paraburkholderia ferrariae]|uniref:VOC family protein n=1 Tax=Paraburkholderia ferrariae TaxID=386056 RepID=UPI0005AB2758|nr:VOC family protein [Paraburkholderia ferrariae]
MTTPLARLSRLILYVHDVSLLKSFYQTHFGFPAVEEIEGEWAVLDVGGVELALHRVGEAYRSATPRGPHSNAKLVFSIDTGLEALCRSLSSAGVSMREPKRYEGFPYLLCDGEDPEGNVFQLSHRD